jgi:hypothetical protein
MAASGNHLLGEVLLRLPAQPVRVTIELGDAFSTPADVLVLKYAQGSYGVDLEALRRLGDANGSITMPRAGEQIAVLAGSAASAHAVVFIGTPPVQRLDYAAVQAWAKSAVAPASPVTLLGEKSGVLTEPTSIVTTVHGVENLDRKLDESQTLRAQLTGFLSGLRSRTAKPKLERIRIVELDDARAERLAEALSKIAAENSGFEPVRLARYSADVQRLASTFDPGVQVTASALAQELQAAHPDRVREPEWGTRATRPCVLVEPCLRSMSSTDQITPFGVVGCRHRLPVSHTSQCAKASFESTGPRDTSPVRSGRAAVFCARVLCGIAHWPGARDRQTWRGVPSPIGTLRSGGACVGRAQGEFDVNEKYAAPAVGV